MTSQDEQCNEYGSLPIVNSIEPTLRRKVALLQVVPDELRNYNIVLVTKDDEVWVYGDNTSGCLGVGHENPVLEKGEPLKQLRGKSVVQIATGNRFVIVRTQFQEIWSWGLNTSSQLAHSDNNQPSLTVPTQVNMTCFRNSNAFLKVVCGHSFGALLSAGGLVYTFGDNHFGQLGTGMPEPQDELNQIYDIDPICDISCGARHLVMLAKCKTKLYVSGDNQLGQLGLKGTAQKRMATVVTLPFKKGESVRAVACGAAHTLVLLSSGMILSFGDNSSNQLGVVLSKASSTCVPHLMQEDEIFEQLFTCSLSNISVARSASTKELYIWGPVREREAYKSLLDRVPPQKAGVEGASNKHVVSTYVLKRPRRACITSVAKLFAVYEPIGLTFNGQVISDGLRRTDSISKCFNDKSQADVHFLLGSHILYGHKVILATYSNYFHRYFDLAPVKSASEPTKLLSTIPICDYSFSVYRGYIYYIYTGLIFEPSLKEKWTEIEVIKYLVELAELALIYEEHDLHEICIEELCLPENELMCPRLVTQIYSEAYRFHITRLSTECTKFMAANWDKMQTLPDFEQWLSATGKSTADEDNKTKPNESTLKMNEENQEKSSSGDTKTAKSTKK